VSQRVISFHYTLTNSSGETLDSSREAEPLAFMEGVQQIIPGLESQIVGLSVGDKRVIRVAAADAYGEVNLSLIVRVPKDKLPVQDIHVGDRFRGGPDQHSPIFMVTEILANEVVLDGNHPLAGQDLQFDVEITGMRPATEEEKSHGHAHGPEGHGHAH
jgi:FKBP-type peptidyl-prolyl cis-trans isomerase SlyD